MSELRRRWTSRELVDIAAEWRLQHDEAEAAGRAGAPGPSTTAPGGVIVGPEPTPDAEARAVKAILGGG